MKVPGHAVGFQSVSDDQWSQFDPTFKYSQLVGLPNVIEQCYNRYRVKSVAFKFIPNKNYNGALVYHGIPGVNPYVPPAVDVHVVDMKELDGFAPQSVLQNIKEQTGHYQLNGLKPFTVRYRPRIQQYRQINSLGNAVSSSTRMPWLPLTADGQNVDLFGKYIYIRNPYEPNQPVGTTYTYMQYQIEVQAVVEFREVKF